MKLILAALVEAFKTLFHPKMLSLVLWPMLAAVALWVGAAMVFWGSWVASLTALIQKMSAEQWMAAGFLAIVSHYLIVFMLAMLLLPAIYVTALAITSVFAMPVMVDHVAAKYYPELARRKGGSTTGSVLNTALAIVVYCAGWMLCLPFWLLYPFAVVLPVVLLAYLNQRLFRYDALAEHADKAEYARIIGRSTGKLYLLGAVVGLLQFVPLLNLVLPIYAGLAFIHLCLAELKQLRQSV
jgi:uncharacterized protein involved in cysteine biosynthesis